MQDYAKNIDTILRRFYSKEINFDDAVACYLLANLRQLIESKQVVVQYPIVYFYACWSLHSSLDRNSFSQQVLSSIAKNLPTDNGCGGPNFIDIVCENLKAENLRQEILTLGNIVPTRA